MTKLKSDKKNARKERGNPNSRNSVQVSRQEERMQHADEVKRLQGTIKKQAKKTLEDKAIIKQQATDLNIWKEKYGDACRDRDIEKNRADICDRNYHEAMDTLKKQGPAVALYAKDVKLNDHETEELQPHKTEKKHISDMEEELFKFIHPSIIGDEALKIHHEIKNLVSRNGLQVICDYLKELRKEKKILLPQSPSNAYAELVRMGMPSGEGFSEITFRKYYSSR